jgi:hypothetical protein
MQQRLVARAADLGKHWPELPVARKRAVLAALVKRIEVSLDQIDIRLRPPRLGVLLDVVNAPLAPGRPLTRSHLPHDLVTGSLTDGRPAFGSGGHSANFTAGRVTLAELRKPVCHAPAHVPTEAVVSVSGYEQKVGTVMVGGSE